jgi:hypothetical protein
MKWGISFDETASQAPRIERLGKQKEKEHWRNVKTARELADHKVFLDANYTEQCERDLNNITTDIGQEKLIERGITVPIDLIEVSHSSLPKELQTLKGLKSHQKTDIGIMCKVIQDEVKDHCDNFRTSTLGYVCWSDAKTCNDSENYLNKWIAEQNFPCEVRVVSITSYQSLKQQKNALKHEQSPGITIWLTKWIMSRGIDKPKMTFGVGFDTRHDEEFSHTVTRINRRHPNDGVGPGEKTHKPRARWYTGKNATTDHTRETLAKLQSIGLTCGNIIVEDRNGHTIIVKISDYTKPNYDTIKKLKGTKIQKAFKTRIDDLEVLKKEMLLKDASEQKTAEDIVNFLKESTVNDIETI